MPPYPIPQVAHSRVSSLIVYQRTLSTNQTALGTKGAPNKACFNKELAE